MKISNLTKLFMLICFFLSAFITDAAASSPAERYFALMDQGLAVSRSQMPLIIASAEEAAHYFIAGGNIYAAGTLRGFRTEAFNRAGGLACVKRLSLDDAGAVVRGDIVLLAVRESLTEDEHNSIAEWRSKGAYVIAFASGTDEAGTLTLPDIVINNGGPLGLEVADDGEKKLCPVDTVVNVINMWVWTGEFTAACTRFGKMPILHQSAGLPGGRERYGKYRGKRFHKQLTPKSIPPGILGNAYLDAIESYLLSFRNTQMDKLRIAARWLGDTKKDAALLTIGHLFPAHFLDPRAVQYFSIQRSLKPADLESLLKEKKFVFFCGYQAAVQEMVDLAAKYGCKLVYLTVKPATIAEPKDNIIYMRPGWPLADACVSVPGYEVPILPPSGVVNAAIYWALLAEASEGGS